MTFVVDHILTPPYRLSLFDVKFWKLGIFVGAVLYVLLKVISFLSGWPIFVALVTVLIPALQTIVAE